MDESRHSRDVELISTLLAISFMARNLADKILNDAENEELGGEMYETDCKNCTNCTICQGSRR